MISLVRAVDSPETFRDAGFLVGQLAFYLLVVAAAIAIVVWVRRRRR